jgi:hypothetical protein
LVNDLPRATAAPWAYFDRDETGTRAEKGAWSTGYPDTTVSADERPMCPVCKHRTALARISPGERGFEERAFECATCGRTDKISLALDPMKSDAVGGLPANSSRC